MEKISNEDTAYDTIKRYITTLYLERKSPQ